MKKTVYLCWLLMLLTVTMADGAGQQVIPFEPSVVFNKHPSPHKVALVASRDLVNYDYSYDSWKLDSWRVDVGNKLIISVYNLLTCKIQHVIPVRDDGMERIDFKKFDLIFIPRFDKPELTSNIFGGYEFSSGIGITILNGKGETLKQLNSYKTKKSIEAYKAVNYTFEASLKGLERQLDDFLFNEMHW